MLNSTTLLADELGQRLSSTFRRTFGGSEPRFAALLDEAARLIIERLATSDALIITPSTPRWWPWSPRTSCAVSD